MSRDSIAQSLHRYLIGFPRQHLAVRENRVAIAACSAFLAAALTLRYSGVISPFVSRSAPAGAGLAEALGLAVEFAIIPYVVAVVLVAFCGPLRRALDWRFWAIGLIAVTCLAGIGYGDQIVDWSFLGRFVVQLSVADSPGCSSCALWNGAIDGTLRSEYPLRAIVGYVAGPLLYAALCRGGRPLRYGLTLKGVDLRAYAVILALVAPLVVAASHRPDFLHAYPRYLPGLATVPRGAFQLASLAVFEVFYALQFVALEFFFRGFLVYSLEPYLGGRAVLPMVCVYCCIHFVKPLPEAASAVLGGYVLGVIALYSRSIIGGMPVHIGIALMLEGLAILRHAP
jgi:Flp pilus assembly pilin Flp